MVRYTEISTATRPAIEWIDIWSSAMESCPPQSIYISGYWKKGKKNYEVHDAISFILYTAISKDVPY